VVASGLSSDRASVCIVIPARFGSKRYPGKPLAKLRGATGIERTLIEWSWRTAMTVPNVGHVVVATDDQRIVSEVNRFGGTAVITPIECSNGTERCAAALAQLSPEIEIVINLQGDNPLTPISVVSSLIGRLRTDPSILVSTPAIVANRPTRAHLLDEFENGRIGGTTVVVDRWHRALYFSKAILPHGAGRREDIPLHLHLGVYGYRRSALLSYAAQEPSVAELAEGLEQLRFLDQGIPIDVIISQPNDGTMVELNNPEDRPVIEAQFARRGME